MSNAKISMMGAAALIAPLALGACATLEEGAAELVAETRYAQMTGAQVVSSSGDPDATATAELTVSDELNQVCYDINNKTNLGPITSVSINRGFEGQVGPAVLRIKAANEGGYKNCVVRSEWLEDSFEQAPGAYYMQISTTEYPNGAIRGQFRRN